MRRTHLSNDWDNRRQSSYKIKENDLRKHEAAMKRERAMAYAFNYQQVSLQTIRFVFSFNELLEKNKLKLFFLSFNNL